MQILTGLIKYYFYMIFIFFMGRLSLFIIYFDRFKDSDVNYWLSFIYGLRMDTIVTSIILIIPMFILTLTPKTLHKVTNQFLMYG